MPRLLPIALLGVLLVSARAQDESEQESKTNPAGKSRSPWDISSVEDLTERVRGSVVTISSGEGSGRGEGIGSGFVVTADGLIATNHHVIGTGRAIRVTFDTGEEYEATEIHASDRKLDLALLRIVPEKDHELVPLELGDPKSLVQGAAVVAFGNPQGFRFSVVSGVVSAWREIEGREMMQLAIPVEQGNSGGPVLDRYGRVHGILTMKSLITENLGFAARADDLQRLLDAPNPVAMADWLHIGGLDRKRWTPLMGATWSRRGGMILVRGTGSGFGGRSLCIAKEKPEGESYEISLEVRLDDEAGAAGIAFCSDSGNVHYGFYPTGGSLRLTRFEGPVVYTWTILEQAEHPAYRKGDWNHLRVQLTPERIRCFANGELVFDSPDTGLRGGRAGLCKFRETNADFRGFRVGTDLARPPNKELRKRIAQKARLLQLADAERPAELARLIPSLAREPDSGASLLAERVRLLEQSARELEELGRQAHQHRIAEDLKAELQNGDPDLLLAGLHIARLTKPELELSAYSEEIDRMTEGAQAYFEEAGEEGSDRVELLGDYLFKREGFHGSRFDYYNPSNSFLDEVIDDREGIPITLSVLFIEIADRLGIEGVHGLPLPTHFMVGVRPEKGERLRFFDAFGGGAELTRAEAAALIAENGARLESEHLRPAGPRDIVSRMLGNLVSIHMNSEEPGAALPYLDLLLGIEPDSHAQRFNRSFIRHRSGDREGARADIEHLLEAEPEGLDLSQLRQLLERL